MTRETVMDIRTISQDLAVSPQIQPDELERICARGFRSILCNRPDLEDSEQPAFEAIAQAARQLGLEVCFQPIIPGEIGACEVAEFREALERLPAPVLAYCRTGTRSATLWARAQSGAGLMTVPEVLDVARRAGYELQGF